MAHHAGTRQGAVPGRVEAPNEAAAITEAIKQFNVPKAQWSRLTAQPVE
jgi:hypothetical protein